MFDANKAVPENVRDLLVKCESKRDVLDAPAWKDYIDKLVTEKSNAIKTAESC